MEEGKQIYQLIPKIMQAIGAVAKNRKNVQQGYQFRGIDDVYNALAGPMAENGVFCVPKVIGEPKRSQWETKNKATMFSVFLMAEFTFYAPDGSSITATTAGEGMDTGDKATNKAMSAALKYAMLDVFCIPTEEPKDSENDSPEPKKKVAGDLDDNEQFVIKVDELLTSRGFKPEQVTKAMEYAASAKKVARLADLSTQSRSGLLAAIAQGKFDKFKENSAGGAGAK